jgi:hypothetical protein
MLIDNLTGLAGRANEVALSNIFWNPNEPFTLLNHIFENIVMEWKETLVTASGDRQLRIDGFKGLIMKNEINNCRTVDVLETIIDGNRKNQNLITQVLGVSISTFNGLETCMAAVFQRFNQVREVIVNNQKIIVKQGILSMNLILKAKKEMEGGFNSLMNRVANGVKSEISLCQEVIVKEIGKKLTVINIGINEVRSTTEKMLCNGFGRMYESLKKDIYE